MPIISHQRITRPGQFGEGFTKDDGLGLCDGQYWIIEDSIIDLSDCDLDEIDECCGVTWGSSAAFWRCHIKGAGKLILCGCGDKEKNRLEMGKEVCFFDSILEDGGRRFPEVQDGMHVYMQNCLIRNWGESSRFDTRNFGIWAHHGGIATLGNCVFWQDTFRRPAGQFVRDIASHIGQAVNDSGVKALLWPTTYLPGVCRGLMAGPGGRVEAADCYRNRRWIRLEGRIGEMDEDDALRLVADLEHMAERLDRELP
ncbi:MAG: hypothetical protein IJU37_12585 [Desulfovibrio sp.]|nr:hypothetical protein [Desulfovibrio sp.]